jgi:hypothetical protein
LVVRAMVVSSCRSRTGQRCAYEKYGQIAMHIIVYSSLYASWADGGNLSKTAHSRCVYSGMG